MIGTNGTNWISGIHLPKWGDLSYLPSGWEEV